MPRILLVSSNDDIRGCAKRLLEKGGHDVVSVEIYTAARLLMRAEFFDALVVAALDCGDAELDLARWCFELDSDLAIVFVNGFAVIPVVWIQSKGKGFFATKGFQSHLSEIGDVVREVLREPASCA